jgi:hypothetical protein
VRPCGARTRGGRCCQRFPVHGRRRCPLHGGSPPGRRPLRGARPWSTVTDAVRRPGGLPPRLLRGGGWMNRQEAVDVALDYAGPLGRSSRGPRRTHARAGAPAPGAGCRPAVDEDASAFIGLVLDPPDLSATAAWCGTTGSTNFTSGCSPGWTSTRGGAAGGRVGRAGGPGRLAADPRAWRPNCSAPSAWSGYAPLAGRAGDLTEERRGPHPGGAGVHRGGRTGRRAGETRRPVLTRRGAGPPRRQQPQEGTGVESGSGAAELK